MAKMFYNAQEAADKIGCSIDDLKKLVRAGELNEFRDAMETNYRISEVDLLTLDLLTLIDQEDLLTLIDQETGILECDSSNDASDDTSLGAELLEEIYSSNKNETDPHSGTSIGNFIHERFTDVKNDQAYANIAHVYMVRAYCWMLVTVVCSIISIISMIISLS